MNNKSSFQKKIAGYSLLAGSLIAVHVDGQVIYTDVQPDVEVGGVVPSDFPYFDSYGLDLNNDGITDFNVNLTISAYNNANSSEGFNFVEIIQPAVDGNFIAAENGGYHLDNAATFLPAEIIGPDLPGQPEWGVEGQLGYVYRYYNTYVNERDNFVVGFQFKISGQIHYGWARLAINTIPSSNPELVNIVLKEYAYESMANTPIGAGNTGQGCPMPENVLVDDILKDEAEVSWTGTGNAYSYSIRYREVGSTTWSYSEVLAPTVLQTMTGLTPSTNYEVEVQTYCDEAKTDSSGYTAAIVFTTDAVCTVPQKLEAINLSATKATINWADDFDGVYKYVLQWREIGTETWITAYIFPPATSKQINNLNPGSQYEVKVQSWCNSTGTSASDFSAPVFFSTTCKKPTSVTVTDVTTTKATVSWTAIGGGDSYRIRKRPVGTTTWIYSSVTAPTTSKQLSNNIPGTEYEVQVQAYCDPAKTDSSGYSSSVFFTSAADCPKPTSVAVSDITDTKATVSWTGNAQAVSYRVRKRPVGTEIWTYSSVTAPTTSKQLSNNAAGTQYEVQVQSYCNEAKTDSSGYTNSVLFTSSGECLGTTSESTTGITSTSATLNWTSPNTPAKWTIKYKVSGSPFTTVKISGALSSYNLSGLTASTNYDWKIMAKCGSETSEWSALQHFTTSALKVGVTEAVNKFSVYPNPANGVVSLQFTVGKEQQVNIKVYDLNGKDIATWLNSQMAEGDHTLSFDVSSFAKGIYFVRMISESGMQNQKLIVQ